MAHAQLNSASLQNTVIAEPVEQIHFSHQLEVEDTLSANFELIKILRRHQGEGRWILLIAPATMPSKELLACCNVDQKGVLVIHHRQVNDSFTTIKNALMQATCEAVVAWDDSLKSEEISQIDELTKQSKSHFYSFSKQAFSQSTSERKAGTINH